MFDEDIELIGSLLRPVRQRDLACTRIHFQVRVSRRHFERPFAPIERSLFVEKRRGVVEPDLFVILWPNRYHLRTILWDVVLLLPLRVDCQL